MLDQRQLTAYRDAAAAAKARADKATPGPWKAENPDDEYCMNVMCVTTGDSYVDDMGPQFRDYGSVVAITLLQSPRYACCESRKWDEDTYFIAAARTDIPTLATAVDELCAEVERLQGELRVAEQRIADFYETGEMP